MASLAPSPDVANNAPAPPRSFFVLDPAFLARRGKHEARIGEIEPWSIAMKRWPLHSLLIVLSLSAPKAHAFIEAPYITPAHPTTITPISVRIHAGGCHGFSDGVDEAELVVVGPGQLRLMTEGINLPPAHPFCIAPDFTYRFDIGTLPAGHYSLEVFIYDEFAAPEPVGFGSMDFLVTAPATIPAISLPPMALLLLALAGFACRRAKRNA